MNITEKSNVGSLVAGDYRLAEVFKRFNIDFCCNGNRTIEEACSKKGIQHPGLIQELKAQTAATDKNSIDYNCWPIDLLADYIEKIHHRYVMENIPSIKSYLERIVKVHGDRHPELFGIAELFDQTASELSGHMKKEELVLFPLIRKLVKAKESGSDLDRPQGSLENLIGTMNHEHDAEGERFRKIAQLSSDYTVPADGCNTYKVSFALLKEFEQDLHLHIHLESNILFPKAIEMEKKVGHTSSRPSMQT